MSIVSSNGLAPGDIVYVDSGYYLLTENITFNASESGLPGCPVRIQESPSGTTLDRNSTASYSNGIELNHADYIGFAHLIITNGDNGIDSTYSDHCVYEDITARNAEYYGFYVYEAGNNSLSRMNIFDCRDGVFLGHSDQNTIRQLLVARCSNNGFKLYGEDGSTNRVMNSTFAYNGANQVYLFSGILDFCNNIVVADGSGVYGIYYSDDVPDNYQANHNILFVTNGAMVGFWGVPWEDKATLPAWRSATTQDLNSISMDPVFVDAANGDFDEYVAGTEGANALSLFQIDSVCPSTEPAGYAIAWISKPGRSYSILRSTNLLYGFSPFATALTATPPTNFYYAPLEFERVFYRLEIER